MEAPPTAGATASQHLQALATANRVRTARAALKRSLASGDAEVAAIVRACPWQFSTMTIGDLLCSQRQWGRVRAHKVLRPLNLSENRELGRLTERQRRLLAAELEARERLGRRASG